MLFFRKRKNKSKLAELLVNSGSVWKAGENPGRRSNQSLDDVYGWAEDFQVKSGEAIRTGIPASRREKAI